MKRYIWAVLVLAALCTGCAKNQDKITDETLIQELTKNYQEAYNKQDPEKIASLWAPDAVFYNPLTDEKAEGRVEIAQFYKEKFANEPHRHLEVTPLNIEIISEDEAIANGVFTMSLPEEPATKIAYQVSYRKENGKWQIEEIREMEIDPTSSNFEHLQDLDWLIGTWQDEDENVTIDLKGEWDQYKNFLTQHFKLKILGNEDLEGKQVIAWDPTENKIRSWVFDSRGTFGEGTWKKLDNSWYVAMKYTLSDGGTAIATNVYTPIDEQTYTFASIEREVDGEILPNLDPVNVEKVK